MSTILRLWLAVVFLPVALFLSGCGQKPSKPQPAKDTAAATESQTDVMPEPTHTGPPDGQKACFQCDGQGTIACTARGCVNGKVDCPGSCLRLNRGAWIHMNVAGHSPNELWQKFSYNGGSKSWTTGHIGEVIAYENGVPENKGKCPVCGGTTKVNCSVCKGSGKQTCPVCQGTKYVLVAWKPNDYPWLNSQPDLIRLKDGRFFLGKIVKSDGDDRLIKTRDSKFTHISASEIVLESSPGAKIQEN